MICKYYDKTFTAATLRERCHTTREGVSMLGISDAAESVGFRTAGVKITFEQIAAEAPLPCIVHWNQKHFVGDLTKQSIKEVWNSPRALELAFPKKENFRNVSICKKCIIFDECYTYHNKCYADVLKAYGDENRDFPDPRCKLAPKFINELNPL
jgi:radical SAM protein with 4Fe4S-binding SPASM domain